jgi:hypothetical protein
MFQQEVHEQPHPRRHCRATYEHRMNRFLVARVPGLQQRYQVTALQVLAHAELADTRNAGTYSRKLCQRFTTAAFDVAADLQGKLFSSADERPVGFGTSEVEGLGYPAISLAGAAMAGLGLLMVLAFAWRSRTIAAAVE